MKLYKIIRFIGLARRPQHNFVFANSEEEALNVLGYKLKRYDSINFICDAVEIFNISGFVREIQDCSLGTVSVGIPAISNKLFQKIKEKLDS
jgi:hypothetical protein